MGIQHYCFLLTLCCRSIMKEGLHVYFAFCIGFTYTKPTLVLLYTNALTFMTSKYASIMFVTKQNDSWPIKGSVAPKPHQQKPSNTLLVSIVSKVILSKNICTIAVQFA